MNILVYDSGIGGRSVFHRLEQFVETHHLQEKIHLAYFADAANYPYGTKNEEELKEIVLGNLDHFESEDFDVVAVACNTASSIIEKYQPQFSKLKVATIIAPTIERIKKLELDSIFVIASNFTASHHIYKNAIHQVVATINVTEQSEQGLINHIEVGLVRETEAEVAKIISQVQEDTALLWGCTHFSLVDDVFYEEMEKQGKHFQIIDPAAILAEEVMKEFS